MERDSLACGLGQGAFCPATGRAFIARPFESPSFRQKNGARVERDSFSPADSVRARSAQPLAGHSLRANPHLSVKKTEHGWRGIRSRLRARSGRVLPSHWQGIHYAPVRIPISPSKKTEHGWRGIRSRLRARSGHVLPSHWQGIHCAPVRIPISPSKKRSTMCSVDGEMGIRTPEGLMTLTRFPVVRLRPTRPSLHM